MPVTVPTQEHRALQRAMEPIVPATRLSISPKELHASSRGIAATRGVVRQTIADFEAKLLLVGLSTSSRVLPLTDFPSTTGESWTSGLQQLSAALRKLVPATPGSDETALQQLAVRRQFQELFSARGTAAQELFASLLGADPELVLHASIREFTDKGNQDRLLLAARLLNEMGSRASLTLQRISLQGFSGQEVFVDLIAQSPALAPNERLLCLQRLARSPQAETRWRLISIIESLPLAAAKELAQVLARDKDEGIRDEALKWLKSLAPQPPRTTFDVCV